MGIFADTEETPLVRIDFSNDPIWRDLLTEVGRPTQDGFMAYITVFEDPALDGRDASQLAREASENDQISLCVFADAVTMTHPERPLLCVDLVSFAAVRVVPSQLQSIENNLSIANMDIEQFVEAAGKDGVFRGFD